MSVTQADVLVHRGLSFAQMIRPTLELLLADLYLSALALVDGLAGLLVIRRCMSQGALRAAYHLRGVEHW
ncbi:hypothetical protein D3C84_1063460 [compost metagenome]